MSKISINAFRGKRREGAEFFAVPGCTLGTALASNCIGVPCEGCGWNEDEQARRKKLIERVGLTFDPETGLNRLVIPERRAQ